RSGIGDDQWKAAGHCLHRGVAEGLLRTRQAEHARACIELEDVRVADVAVQVASLETLCAPRESPELGSATDDVQASVPMRLADPRPCIEQNDHTLARIQVRDAQHPRIRA